MASALPKFDANSEASKTSSNGHQPNTIGQRNYLLTIRRTGNIPPNRPSFEDCSEDEQKAVGSIETLARGSRGNLHLITGKFKQFENNALARILGDGNEQKNGVPQQEGEAPKLEIVTDLAVAPPLPEGIHLPRELSKGVCPLRDEYIQYSERLSPEGYSEFHEACFWAMASMVAARRIYTDMDSRIYTSLYIVLAAKTSLFAKTETANVTKKVLKAAGLDWLLGANRTTPQKLMSDMAGKYIPDDYDDLPYDEQELLKLRLAMSGQVGWIYDEFGKFVRGMLRQNSIMSDFDELFLSFEGSPDNYRNATIARNSEPIKRPYLALLGCMTPASVRFSAKTGTESWSDGFWPRFAFITPPTGTEKDSPFTRGEKPVPSSISTPLRQWHDRLGVPEIDIVAKIDEKGKATGKHEKVTIKECEETKIEMSDGAYDAWVKYRSALKSMLKNFPHEDLHGSYDRLPVKALRVATLVASLENSPQITIQHWTLAQEVTESWRTSLHRFYSQVNAQSVSGPTMEEKVLEYVVELHRKGQETVSARDISKCLHKDSKDVLPYLRSLAREGDLEEIKGRQNPRFKVARSQDKPQQGVSEQIEDLEMEDEQL